MFISKKRIVADEEIDVNIDAPVDDVEFDAPADDEVGSVNVDEEAAELLFETEDVAELIAEVVGEPVDVTVEDNGEVKFAVGDDEFTVSPEGDEELLEASTKIRGRRPIRASVKGSARGRRPVRRPVKASTSVRRPAARSARRATRK